MRETGQIDRAIADYTKAIQLNPELALALYINRSIALRDKGEFDLALADLNEALRIEPRYSLSYSNRGEVWLLKGDLDRALADQNRAIDLDPKRTLSYVRRADILRYKGEFARAIADYAQAIRLQPDYVPAIVGQALTYERMGDLSRAQHQYRNAIASKDVDRLVEVSKSALETARARLAALEAGITPPTIMISQSSVKAATSIPTQVVANVATKPSINQLSAGGRRVALVIGNSASGHDGSKGRWGT